MILVFTGLHWAWKWTQARILQEKLGFFIYESSHILRHISLEDSSRGALVKDCMESGKFVSRKIMEDILDDILKKWEPNIILDGFLRTSDSQDLLFSKLSDFIVVVFNFTLDMAKIRLNWRMYDSKTGETFPAGTLMNPKTRTPLTKKPYDTHKEKIENRLNLYVQETVPMIEQMRNSWIKIIDIDATKSISEVSSELCKKLNI